MLAMWMVMILTMMAKMLLLNSYDIWYRRQWRTIDITYPIIDDCSIVSQVITVVFIQWFILIEQWISSEITLRLYVYLACWSWIEILLLQQLHLNRLSPRWFLLLLLLRNNITNIMMKWCNMCFRLPWWRRTISREELGDCVELLLLLC